MLFSTIQRSQRWPLPVAQDADLRTRLSVALRSLEQGIAVVRSLQTTIMWSMWMVQDPDASETDQLAALDRLAQYLARRRWEVHDQRVRTELRRRMNDTGASWMTVKSEVLKTAWWLVLRGDSNEPQTVRFRHGGWLVDESGHKLPIVPDDLPFPITFRWAKNQAIKTAKAILLEQSEAGHETNGVRPGFLSLDDPRTSAKTRDLDADADPLYAILERETTTEDAARYAALLQLATPAQQRLLVALLAQLEADRSMTDGAIKAAAESLGISAGTARAQLHRLRTVASTAWNARTSGNSGDSGDSGDGCDSA
ncbi:MAG TPA: hypothetical protein VFW17_00490 [Ktedonobacterales bacterium]|nr:hypothetical protein [Ktedonobacterales bacterium]